MSRSVSEAPPQWRRDVHDVEGSGSRRQISCGTTVEAREVVRRPPGGQANRIPSRCSAATLKGGADRDFSEWLRFAIHESRNVPGLHPSDRDDAAQEAILGYWRALQRGDPVAEPTRFLKVALRRQAGRFRRARCRERRYLTSGDVMDATYAHPTPSMEVCGFGLRLYETAGWLHFERGDIGTVGKRWDGSAILLRRPGKLPDVYPHYGLLPLLSERVLYADLGRRYAKVSLLLPSGWGLEQVISNHTTRVVPETYECVHMQGMTAIDIGFRISWGRLFDVKRS